MRSVNDDFLANEFSGEKWEDVRLEYSGFHSAKMQSDDGDFSRHIIWCPHHFALILEVSIDDEKLMDARIIAPEKAPPLEALDEKVFLIGGRHQCVAGMAKPNWKNEKDEISARLFLLSSDGFSGVGVSRYRSGVLQAEASPPVAIEFNVKTKRALVVCAAWSTLHLNGARFELESGRHELQLP